MGGRRRLLVSGLAAIGLIGCLATIAFSADRRIDVSTSGVHRIFLPISQSVTVEINSQLGDMVVADEKIADAQPMTDRTLYIIGKGVGTTSIHLFSEDRRSLGVIEVEVGIDVDDLRTAIRQVAPQSHIIVGSVNGRVRLAGHVSDGATLAKILQVAEQYGQKDIINAVSVDDSQQVNLEVRVLEVARTAGRELGLGWLWKGDHSKGAVGPGVTSLLPSGNAPFANIIATVLNHGISVDAIIKALEDKRLARRLAEPNLTALSGETASFLAGGEVPVPVAQDNNTITVEYKDYGVKLQFTPIVLEDGKINLRLTPEVSEVDPTQSIKTDLVELPAFVTRRASTVVELRDGQSFAIAGLLQSNNRKLQSQLPWIGQIPILGALFRSSSYIKNETELVIIVTPRLVRPVGPGQRLATPFDKTLPANDPEFFLLGQLEVTKAMIRKYELGEGVIGPYGHMLDVSSKDALVYVKK